MINTGLRRGHRLEMPFNQITVTQVLNTGMGKKMKSLMQNVVSIFKQGLEFAPIETIEGPVDIIISGYSHMMGEDDSCTLGCKPVGILYADIAGYARLTEADEEGTHLRLVECMEILKAHIAANNGRVAHSAGDAILAEFMDCDSALRCAINVQHAAWQWNANLERTSQVQFRIGVNFGEVISDQGDIYGKAVNLAARLEGLACSGGICVSDTVRSNLETGSEFKFVALGKQYVKNISEPVEAFWIEIDAQHIVDANLTNAVKVSKVVS